MAFLRNVLVAALCAAFGGYLLRFVPGYVGSCGGSLLVLLALFIAFPTQMQVGLTHTKEGLATIVPVIVSLWPGKRDASAQQRANDTGTPNPPPPQVAVRVGAVIIDDADKGGAQ